MLLLRLRGGMEFGRWKECEVLFAVCLHYYIFAELWERELCHQRSAVWLRGPHMR